MQQDPYALDRLDIRFQWGRYGIQVLRCHLTAFEAGSTIPAHKHREYEFHFIPWGQGSVILHDGEFPLHGGMFYLTGPQVVHRQDIDQWDPMDTKLYIFRFDEGKIVQFSEGIAALLFSSLAAQLQVEHILCRARGGSNRTSNLTLGCSPCNIKKGTQDIRFCTLLHRGDGYSYQQGEAV